MTPVAAKLLMVGVNAVLYVSSIHGRIDSCVVAPRANHNSIKLELVANCFVIADPANELAFKVLPNIIPAMEIHVLGLYHGVGDRMPVVFVNVSTVNPPANTEPYMLHFMFG